MLASVGIGQETQYEYKTYTGLGCGECPGGEEWNCGVHASWRDGTASECQVPEGEELVSGNTWCYCHGTTPGCGRCTYSTSPGAGDRAWSFITKKLNLDYDQELCEDDGFSWGDDVTQYFQCCGDDDSTDCNLVDGQNLCWNQGDAWNWMKAEDYPGKILDSGCNATCEGGSGSNASTNSTHCTNLPKPDSLIPVYGGYGNPPKGNPTGGGKGDYFITTDSSDSYSDSELELLFYAYKDSGTGSQPVNNMIFGSDHKACRNDNDQCKNQCAQYSHWIFGSTMFYVSSSKANGAQVQAYEQVLGVWANSPEIDHFYTLLPTPVDRGGRTAIVNGPVGYVFPPDYYDSCKVSANVCGSKSVLSDGSKWISCASSFYFQKSPTGSTDYQKKNLTWSTSADFGGWSVPYINCESLHLDTYYDDKKKAIYSNLNLPQNDYTLTFKSAGWNDGGCSRSYFGVKVYGEGDSVIYTESSTSRRPIDCFNTACVYPTGKTGIITFSGKPTKIEFEGSFTQEGSQSHGHLFIDSVTLSWSGSLNDKSSSISQIQNPYKVTSSYLCYNGTITECCGDSSCNSLVGGVAYGGVRQTTGAVFNLTDNIYYCADDLNWTTDLDIKSQNSCEKAGFTGTGSKCCSEADDPEEYYNDNVSGCWNSSAVLSGNFPRNASDVVNYNGTFYGCNINATTYIDDNQHLLNLGDTHTGNALINNTDYCYTLADGYYYCAYTEKWTVGGEAQMKLSYVPWNETNTTNTTWREAGCCGTDKCFNGTACIKTQIKDTQHPGYKGYRCVDGNWNEAHKVCTPDGDTCGYCPRNNQCLVNLQGNFQDNDNPNGNPQCIADKQYIEDDYCEGGNWTSRTKWIALQLLDLATTDYALFCGDYEKVLNYLDYVVKDAKLARNYADETNNYCVLVHSGGVVFGTSLNNESDSSKFDDIVGESCSNVTQEDGLYHPCSQSYRAWYNKKLKSAIYSKTTIQLSDSTGKFQQYLGLPFADLVKTLSQKVTNPYDYSFINTALKFRNVYVAEQGQKSALGSIEGELYRSLAIRYLNFNTDVCKLAGAYNQSNSDIMSGIFCNKETNGYYILAQGNIFTALDPSNIWPDMTGKLRMS